MTDTEKLRYRVQVTLPHHREAPGQVIETHSFSTRADAEVYAEKVRAQPGGFFGTNIQTIK